MAFSYTMIDREILGTRWFSWGTYTNASSSGGDIDTGLDVVEGILLQPTSSTATIPYANETFPCLVNVSIVCATGGNDLGLWYAWGR